MVFKLVRIDTEEPSKIPLLVGKHVIGRGKFLHSDANDKRVSRNHAELEVTEDSILIKSLHINPCFYRRKSTVDIEILQQDNTVALNNGDQFGLIPDNFWYEVVYCSSPDSFNNLSELTNMENKVTNNENEHKNNEEIGDQDMPENTEINETSVNKEDQAINFEINEEGEETNRSVSPSLLCPEGSDQELTENCQVPSPLASDVALSSSLKRSPDQNEASPTGGKRVKQEPVQPDAQPGPRNDQAGTDSDQKDTKPNIAAIPVAPSAHTRERCMYGANCYRRNPQHKAQFSHPSDSDWGAGERGVCPYGRACRKRDPRHWRQHDHPPGVLAPAPDAMRPGQGRKRHTTRRPQASESEEDDEEDSPGQALIVTGKRARKTINRNTWDDTQSDDAEDPYNTDDSDDWQPPSDFTNSEFSQNF